MSDVTQNVLDPTSIQNSIKSLNNTITKSKSAAVECQNQLKQAEARLAFTEALLKAAQLDEQISGAWKQKQDSVDKAIGPRAAAEQKLKTAKDKLASVRKLTPEEVAALKKELEDKKTIFAEKQAEVTAAAEELQKATSRKQAADNELQRAMQEQREAQEKSNKGEEALRNGQTPAQKAEEEVAERELKQAQVLFDKADAEYNLEVRKAEQKYMEIELQVRRDQLELLQLAEDKSQPAAPAAG